MIVTYTIDHDSVQSAVAGYSYSQGEEVTIASGVLVSWTQIVGVYSPFANSHLVNYRHVVSVATSDDNGIGVYFVQNDGSILNGAGASISGLSRRNFVSPAADRRSPTTERSRACAPPYSRRRYLLGFPQSERRPTHDCQWGGRGNRGQLRRDIGSRHHERTGFDRQSRHDRRSYRHAFFRQQRCRRQSWDRERHGVSRSRQRRLQRFRRQVRPGPWRRRQRYPGRRRPGRLVVWRPGQGRPDRSRRR